MGWTSRGRWPSAGGEGEEGLGGAAGGLLPRVAELMFEGLEGYGSQGGGAGGRAAEDGGGGGVEGGAEAGVVVPPVVQGAAADGEAAGDGGAGLAGEEEVEGLELEGS